MAILTSSSITAGIIFLSARCNCLRLQLDQRLDLRRLCLFQLLDHCHCLDQLGQRLDHRRLPVWARGSIAAALASPRGATAAASVSASGSTAAIISQPAERPLPPSSRPAA